ncbi:HPr family phosphocarrier protein [Mycoplasma todarodis]|uniref:HPr family phosphocarrier protein n=1 Tax=Mycoplasma todarodis TaxID=1937191 RepID=UPI003AB8826B
MDYTLDQLQLQFQQHGKSGNLKSIMNIMALGVKQGDEITITAEGSDADAAVAEIEKIMKENNLI